MAPIKDLQLTYEAPYQENAFSTGELIRGVVTFTVTRETKVQSLQVKVKGDAHVDWTETKGLMEKTYTEHQRFFKVKQDLVAENLKDSVLPCAVHSFQFKLKIPQGNIPPSFKGGDARIVYMLEAKISWGWCQISRVTKELKVVPKFLPVISQTNLPLARISSKRVGTFPKSLVRLSAALQKRLYSPGDTVSVVAKITNSSPRRMTPKFNILQTTTCCVDGHTHSTDKILYEAVGKTIEEDTEETITRLIKIPADATPTFLNCISVEYSLKVYANVSKTDVPAVTLPLIITTHRLASQQSSGIDVEALLHRDVSLPALVVRSGVVPAPRNVFEYSEPHPTQQANTSDNQWSLLVPPQPPPPSYDSLYPTPHDVNVTNRQVKKSLL